LLAEIQVTGNGDILSARAVHQTFFEYSAALYLLNCYKSTQFLQSTDWLFKALIASQYLKKYTIVGKFVQQLLKSEKNIFISLPVEKRQLLSQQLADAFFYPLKTIDEEDIPYSLEIPRSNTELTDKTTTNKLTELLQDIKDQRSQRCDSEISRIPNLAVTTEQQQECVPILMSVLNSWWYRVKGAAAQVLGMEGFHIVFDDDSHFQPLVTIIKDSKVYEHQRCLAIAAMAKVKHQYLDKLWSYYKELLNNKKLPASCHHETLVQINSLLVKFSDNVRKEIKSFSEDFKIHNLQSADGARLALIILIILKDLTNNIYSFKEIETQELAKIAAINITGNTVWLILSACRPGLLNLKFSNLENDIIMGLCRTEIKSSAANILKLLFSYLSTKAINDIFFNFDQNLPPSILNIGLLFDSQEQACSLPRHHIGFWEVDACLPMIAVLGNQLNWAATCCAIYYIRYKVDESQIESGLINLITSLIKTVTVAPARLLTLRMALEYFYTNHQRKRVSEIYYIKQLFDKGWEHFTSGSHYPLVGLDMIFTLGFYYGLPLIESQRGFELMLPVSQPTALLTWVSPTLNSIQIAQAKGHFSALKILLQENSGKLYKPSISPAYNCPDLTLSSMQSVRYLGNKRKKQHTLSTVNNDESKKIKITSYLEKRRSSY